MRRFFNNKGEEVPASQATWAEDIEWDDKGRVVSSSRYFTDKFDGDALAAAMAAIEPEDEPENA